MKRTLAHLLAAFLLLAGGRAAAQDAPAPTIPDQFPQARGVDVEEHVGQTLPMELVFQNSRGKNVRLGDYFKGGANGKPAIIAMVYYKCPVICTVVMQRMAEAINQLDLTVGKDYNALVFSFDPTETPKQAAQQKLAFISGYSKDVTPEVEAGWEFHTSITDDAPRALADALGFKYHKNQNGYSHPVALFIITPDGKVSRYLYGFVYPARDVKLALLEASQGKLVKTIGDRLMNYCFLYDSKAGQYTLALHRVMQIGGAATVAAVGTLIGGYIIAEKIRKSRAAKAKAAPDTKAQAPSVITTVIHTTHTPAHGGRAT